MKTLGENKNSMFKNLIYVSIISADNDEYPEEIKQEILNRHKTASEGYEDPTDSRINWEYVFEPLGEHAKRYVELMKA